MGCDIHLHVEVKIEGVWHHYAAPSISRDYRLFTKLAGVRNYDWEEPIVPIAEPRGLPEDVTFLTQFDSNRWEGDGHSHSWISSSEIGHLADWGRLSLSSSEPSRHWDLERELGCYLFGNGFNVLTRYPEDAEPGLEDVRFVFWFDN